MVAGVNEDDGNWVSMVECREAECRKLLQVRKQAKGHSNIRYLWLDVGRSAELDLVAAVLQAASKATKRSINPE